MILEPLEFPINLVCPSCSAKFHFERTDQPIGECPPDHLPRVVSAGRIGYVLSCEFCAVPLERLP